MKEYEICVFSGTGNTKKCAERLQEELLKLGQSASITIIENGKERKEGAGIPVICYPVHGFGAPRNVIDFVKNIPNGQGDAYIVKTSGEPLRLNDDSSATITRLLQKKGYSVRAEYHYIMPYNMIFRHTDAMASKMFSFACKKIAADAQEIVSGVQTAKKIPLCARVAYTVNRIERPGVRFNGLLFHINKKECVKCGLCVKCCPMDNIKFEDGKFRFGNNCILCARCSFTCPKDAIRIGLMDFLRVNGRYNFDADPSEAKIGRYCRRSYIHYFSEE